METSMLLHLCPDRVQMDDAGRGVTHPSRLEAVNDGLAWIARPWHLLTEDSGVGDPSLATAEKGAAFLEASARKLSSFLVALSEAEVDETFPY
jgi:creatinine amidohydrolase